MSSEEGARVAAAAEAEGRRLAYVGMTRARDTLIIALPPSGPGSTAWIANFNSRHLLPTGDEHPLPDGEPIPSAVVDLAAGESSAPAAELVNPHRDEAVDRAAALIRNGAGEGALSPRDAVDCARRLMDEVHTRFALRRMLVEHPVELVRDNGQVLRGWVDLLLETEQGWIVIDQKSSPRPRSEWAAEALEYSGQLSAYANALRGAGLYCAGCWVHFPVSGGLVEIVFG